MIKKKLCSKYGHARNEILKLINNTELKVVGGLTIDNRTELSAPRKPGIMLQNHKPNFFVKFMLGWFVRNSVY